MGIDNRILATGKLHFRNFIRKRSPVSRIVGITAVVTLFVCVLFTLISQLMHPGYNPIHDAISILVWGPGGWLQTVSFGLLAFSVIILGVKLYLKPHTPLAYKIGVLFLILMGIGTVVVSFYPTDIPGSTETLTGAIHIQTAASLVFLFPLACFLVAPHLKKNLVPKWVSRYTYLAGGLSLALIAVIAVFMLGDHGFMGTLERLIMANGLTWVQLMHIQLL
jgi:hypothetical protein